MNNSVTLVLEMILLLIQQHMLFIPLFRKKKCSKPLHYRAQRAFYVWFIPVLSEYLSLFSLFTSHPDDFKSLQINCTSSIFFNSISTYLLRTNYIPGASQMLRIQTRSLLSQGFYSDSQREAITKKTKQVISGGFMYHKGNKIK